MPRINRKIPKQSYYEIPESPSPPKKHSIFEAVPKRSNSIFEAVPKKSSKISDSMKKNKLKVNTGWILETTKSPEKSPEKITRLGYDDPFAYEEPSPEKMERIVLKIKRSVEAREEELPKPRYIMVEGKKYWEEDLIAKAEASQDQINVPVERMPRKKYFKHRKIQVNAIFTGKLYTLPG